eukprot:scaffold7382_cov406-Prasinococcus_capsulatus_cf.AAC.12
MGFEYGTHKREGALGIYLRGIGHSRSRVVEDSTVGLQSCSFPSLFNGTLPVYLPVQQSSGTGYIPWRHKISKGAHRGLLRLRIARRSDDIQRVCVRPTLELSANTICCVYEFGQDTALIHGVPGHANNP